MLVSRQVLARSEILHIYYIIRQPITWHLMQKLQERSHSSNIMRKKTTPPAQQTKKITLKPSSDPCPKSVPPQHTPVDL